MRKWVWLERGVIIALHAEQLAEHGGRPGLRDAGLLDSALARPVNKAQYGAPAVTDLAAAYGFGIIRNHPFIDGNKRTALIATELFLELNGCELAAGDVACLTAILALAEGAMAEEAFAAWLAAQVIRKSQPRPR